MTSNTGQHMNAVVMQASGPPSQALAVRSEPVPGLASVFIEPADGAHVFDQLAVLFDRGLLIPPATKTWLLEDSVEA